MRYSHLRWLLIMFVLMSLCLVGLSQMSAPASFNTAAPPLQITGTPFYLPLVVKDPICQLDAYQKDWSGIHLGNRRADWNENLLACLDGSRGGTWPDMVVVLSSHVYEIKRRPDSHADAPCRIYEAAAARPEIFGYIKRATQAGVKVVIRIHPSPGNFEDWDDPTRPNHRLSADLPVGGDYCHYSQYRSKGDIGDEMGAIRAFNLSQGFIEFGFEPANEPNVEWYSDQYGAPRNFQAGAWLDMDKYFSDLYDYVHKHYPGVRVFTPPMGQGAFAENIFLTSPEIPCEPMLLADRKQSGYDVMRRTYGIKNDGLSFHNYWAQGKEFYNFCPFGHHILRHLPERMKETIRKRKPPLIISEADLASPSQMGGINPLTDKDANPTATADSIRLFFDAENLGAYFLYGVKPQMALWLLNEDNAAEYPEHAWYAAYTADGVRRPWFEAWWGEREEW